MLADDRARKVGDRPKGSAGEGGVRARPEGREEQDEKRDARGARHGRIQGKRQGESLGGKREKRRKVCKGRIGRTMGFYRAACRRQRDHRARWGRAKPERRRLSQKPQSAALSPRPRLLNKSYFGPF